MAAMGSHGGVADLAQLASLVVDALEIGTGKAERDVGDDLCRALAVDLPAIEARFTGRRRDRKRKLRAAVSAALTEGAGSSARLMTELVRCGGRFLAMVEEIYEFLSRHRATTAGTSEEFRFRREGKLLDLPISPAFIEKVRVTERLLQNFETGTIDEAALSHFLGFDNGEFYGSWPVGASQWGHSESVSSNLAREITQLAWIQTRVRDDERLESAVLGAIEAAEQLVRGAEYLLVAHANLLRSAEFIESLDHGDVLDRRTEYLLKEREILERYGVIGASVNGGYYVGIVTSQFLGVRVGDLSGSPGRPGARPGPVVTLGEMEYHYGTSLSHLACLVALWRGALVRTEAHNDRHADPLLRGSNESIRAWLSTVEAHCREAIKWLERDVWKPTGLVTHEQVVESLVEYLNLPLWRHRSLLYEIWLLCTTISAARSGGWKEELLCLVDEGDVWSLNLDPSKEPVARITLPLKRPIAGLVWREPRREFGTTSLTPDISISTVGPDYRDLIVVEAKDRYEMVAGALQRAAEYVGIPLKESGSSARAVGDKYVRALGAVVTWVCNHCDFRETDLDPGLNYGDPWRQLYLGSAVRPGNIPAAFTSSVRDGLRPPGMLEEVIPPITHRLVFVVDTTGSMHPKFKNLWNQFRTHAVLDHLTKRFSEFRGVLFSDHGAAEPYLLYEVGPFDGLEALLEALVHMPLGNGGDIPEALEDAIQHCRRLAAELGPMSFLVLTDAPPHSASECPESIDFQEEMRSLLSGGSACFVANDWQDEEQRSAWAPFEGSRHFQQAALEDLLLAIEPVCDRVTDQATSPSIVLPPTAAPSAGPRSRLSSR